ncbi:MAG: phosphate signaling complex protein PhoU [Oscillospiraceae bacterium]|nr:phosphate signaling complex protein PhoU [Oscillospiraceae bacterium]
MRSNFDKQLETLQNRLAQMATYIEAALDCAVTALITQDLSKAEKAVEYETDIDRMERETEDLCLRILLLQRPVAKDLRTVSAALKMITDMERIGDQARDIGEILLQAPYAIRITADSDISRMATATIKMVHDVVEAFIRNDMAMAEKVISYDDVIDEFYARTKEDLIAEIRAGAMDVNAQVDLLSIAKYFERIGDHATNIAEWVIFSITGRHKI